MANIVFQNVDRNGYKLKHSIQQLMDNPTEYAAALIQDCPRNLGPDIEQLLNAASEDYQAISAIFPDNVNSELSTRLISITNNHHCFIKQQKQLGNAKTTVQVLEIELINNNNNRSTNNQTFFLGNIYIWPKTDPLSTKTLLQDVAKYINLKTSRLLLAGDFNASSALWDRLNQENVMRSVRTKNQHYAYKTQRVSAIERFACRHQMTTLLQTTEPQPTFTETDCRSSWIDVALVGLKANRVWQAVQAMEPQKQEYRQHLPIKILSATSQQGCREVDGNC